MTISAICQSPWSLVSDEDLVLLKGYDEDIFNAFHSNAEPLELVLLGKKSQLYVTGEVATSPLLKIGLSVGDDCGAMEVSLNILEHLKVGDLLANQTFEVSKKLALYIEYRLLSLIEAVEASLSDNIALFSSEDIPNQEPLAKISFALNLSGGDVSFINLYLPHAAMAKIAHLYNKHVPDECANAAAIPISLFVIGGYQDITLAELRSLRIGDAVVLNRHEAVFVSETLCAVVRCENNSFELLETPSQLNKEEFYMATPKDDRDLSRSDDVSGISSKQIDSMPVRVICEIGRLNLPLAEVRALKAGSVISLSRPLESAVDIVVNGQRMGRGSLVKIDDVVGLRVDEINLDD